MLHQISLPAPSSTTCPDGAIKNGGISYWMQDLGHISKRPPLPGHLDVDVAIAGGGMTGLWTAYYLKKADPGLSIAILEKSFVGFGASGRNAGWLSAEPAGMFSRYAKVGGVDSAIALQKAMFETVDEALRVLDEEDIDAGVAKDGLMYVAVNKPQRQRLRTRFDGLHKQGWSKDDLTWLDASETQKKIHIPGAIAGYTTPHCARVNPAKLTAGLANVVEALGVKIYEDTTVEDFAAHKVLTNRGTVKANVIVRALEGYTNSLKGEKRTMLPMNSSILITEQLSDDLWNEMGWKGGHLLGDAANSYTYMQKTADHRLLIGGRGVPYNYAGSFDPYGKVAEKTVLQLRAHISRLFPMAASAKAEHTWSGVLGVPRNWSGAVTHNRETGLITAGGYVGHGVAGTNLAARTVRDLVLNRHTELTSLPWVGFTSRNWEFEPVRWFGATALYAVYNYADKLETNGNQPSKIGKLADRISGRH